MSENSWKEAARKRALVLGIAGGSASGKSTLAQEIVRLLASQTPTIECSLVGTDRFFRSADPTAPRIAFSLLPGEETFDFNRLESADNAALGAEIKRLAASGVDVVIVEGLMLLAIEDLRELCDLKVFVDLEDDVRLARRVLRDIDSTRRFTQPREIVQYYLESARIGHSAYVQPSKAHADLIVRGDAEAERTARLIYGALNELQHRSN